MEFNLTADSMSVSKSTFMAASCPAEQWDKPLSIVWL